MFFMDSSLFLHQSEEDIPFNSTFNDVDSGALYGPDQLQVQGSPNLQQVETFSGIT